MRLDTLLKPGTIQSEALMHEAQSAAQPLQAQYMPSQHLPAFTSLLTIESVVSPQAAGWQDE